MSAWRLDDGGRWPLGRFDGLAALPSVVHAVTTRDGPAFGTVATAAATGAAAAEVAGELGLSLAAWVRQVHGGVVLRVDEAGLAGEADALVSDRPGLLLCGRSADCPLVLAAGERPDGSVAVGFAHASWRSTVAGITGAMVARLVGELGVVAGTVRAGIAPSAGPCCYEVGDEVRELAVAGLGAGVERFFLPVGGRWHFDLWGANREQLVAGGVRADRVEVSGVCTICRGERFWSWRRDGEAAGRFAGVVGVRG